MAHHPLHIILKWAETSDGFLARSDLSSKWISCEASRRLVHLWRAEVDAVLVGTTTAQVDDPHLTVRGVQGENPVRVVIDRMLRIPPTAHLYDGEAPLWVFNDVMSERRGDLRLIKVPWDETLPASISTHLAALGVKSLLIEGGARTLKGFIDAGIWDEARKFVAPGSFGKGIKAPLLPETATLIRSEVIELDQLLIYQRIQAN